MNDRIVYLGPFNNKKQNELINKALEYLKDNRGHEFYYLLPNGELLKKYRQDFINRVKSTFEINIFTFDDIVNKILKDDSIQTIDNPMKNLVIKEALRTLALKEELVYYKKLIDIKGFIHFLNDIIGEIKRSLIYPEDYLSSCPNEASFKEIGLIYKEYEKILKEFNLQDREGTYFKAIDRLRIDNFLKDLNFIIIDEFYDFRPIELAILKELINNDLDIYINMPFDMKNRSPVLDETLNTLKELGFTIKYIEKDNKNLFEEIGSNLFSENREILPFTEKIQIINGPTPYLELRRIFEEIKRLHYTGVRLEDIGIILSDPEYQPTLFKVSEEEKIPISIDKDIGLSYLPLAREVLGILENRISYCHKFNLINRIKSQYFNIFPRKKKDAYELIIRKLNFEDINGLKSLLEQGTSLNISQESLEDLKEIIYIIEDEVSSIPEKDTIINYNKYLLNKFEEFHIIEKILEMYKKTRDEKLFLRDLSGINKIKEILSIIESFPLFKDEISLEDYYLILEEHLEEETIKEEEGNLKGVHIFNPVNSRGILKDIIFITGLSQGSYPYLENNNYFINEDNLKKLKNIGINTKSYMERLNNEILKFSSMVSSCKEKLYLSYNRGSTDVSLPSMFLDELLELFIKNEENSGLKEVYIDLGYLIKKDINNISNKKDLTKYLIYKFYNDKDVEPGVYRFHEKINPGTIAFINQKIQGEIHRSNSEFNKYRGFLEDEIIIKDINKNINNIFSISYLESYSICPYSFMLNNLFDIGPMERDSEDYNPMDIGTIYHEVLRHYYQYHLEDIREHILGNKEFCVQDTQEYLRKIVHEYAYQYGLNLEFKKQLLIVENMLTRLMDFLKKDLERLAKWNLIPCEFEANFGKHSKFFIKKNGIEIPMVGRIDRIDKFIEEDKYVIIDYKTSAYGTRDIRDMQTGLSLQLPVYIMSQKDKDVVAGAYGIINDGSLEIKLGLVEETKILTRRNIGALSREEWDELMKTIEENIIGIIKNINKGDFSVKPLECSNYCIYRDICRYEDILEVVE